VEQLSKKHKFSLKTPIEQLSPKAMNIILFGNEDGMQGDIDQLEKGEYPGVINMVVRWFTDSTSDAIR
jgi:excinuclease ABC subunit A